MRGRRAAIRFAGTGPLAILLVAVGAGWTASQALPHSWATYRNERWGFCLQYPAGWKPAPAPTDDSGIDLLPLPGEGPAAATAVSVGGLPNQLQDIDNPSAVADHSPPLTLAQNFARSLKAMREYGHASHIRLIERSHIRLQGYPALVTVVRYRAPPDATEWVDKTLWINKAQVIFTATLNARPATYRRLLPTFNEIALRRLRLNCPPTE